MQQNFNGADYSPALDNARLGTQHERIKTLMLDGEWRSLNEIAAVTRDPQASILAQLGHLRKERFGGYTVEKRRRGEVTRGLYEYRVLA